ncbi:MAG: hypothetical protein AAF657_11260 [Acidobacteriota bacterium]
MNMSSYRIPMLLIPTFFLAVAAGAAPGAFGLRTSLERASMGPESLTGESQQATPLRLGDFGIALVDVDPETIRELAPFSSLIDVHWADPELVEHINLARAYGMKPLIGLHDLFFVRDETQAVAIPPWSLRPDYEARWTDFVAQNRSVLGASTVWAFYLVDEPFHNRIPVADLLAADRAVKAVFPLIPTMSSFNRHDIEAAPDDLPADFLDLVGYHAYAVPQDPNVDPEYQHYLHLLLDKLAGRDWVIVADAWWREDRHGAAGFDVTTLIERAGQYRAVAEEIGAVALGAFVWQDAGGGTGLRELPEDVLREYIRIAAEVSGRCGLAESAAPLAGGNLLRLQSCRFQARAHWRDPVSGVEGEGIAVPLTRDTGVFWFFEGANIEITLKILDGTAFNDHWWVYWSGMTHLEVWLEVTDTVSGAVKVYREPARDTEAFANP